MMFVGDFQYNRKRVYDPSYTSSPDIVQTEDEWWVTGYTYDENLTETYIQSLGVWSPIDPIKVNWSVYRLIDAEHHPNARMIKVFAQPKIKSTQQWVLIKEADFDSEGNMQFYSFDAVYNERIKSTENP
jgi:tellurite resistance-related uncharacterized protein